MAACAPAAFADNLPLVEPVGGYQAAVLGEAGTEGRLRVHRLGTCIVQLRADGDVLRPVRHQPPAHHLPHPAHFWPLPDHQDVAGRRNVVARGDVRAFLQTEPFGQARVRTVENVSTAHD